MAAGAQLNDDNAARFRRPALNASKPRRHSIRTLGDVMTPWDVAGYLASGLVVMAFCMEDIVLLRAVALSSNVAFLIYGIGLGLVPVWLLHATLLPVNGWRLWQVIARRCTQRPNGESSRK
jgi:hypothetical protein